MDVEKAFGRDEQHTAPPGAPVASATTPTTGRKHYSFYLSILMLAVIALIVVWDVTALSLALPVSIAPFDAPPVRTPAECTRNIPGHCRAAWRNQFPIILGQHRLHSRRGRFPAHPCKCFGRHGPQVPSVRLLRTLRRRLHCLCDGDQYECHRRWPSD